MRGGGGQRCALVKSFRERAMVNDGCNQWCATLTVCDHVHSIPSVKLDAVQSDLSRLESCNYTLSESSVPTIVISNGLDVDFEPTVELSRHFISPNVSVEGRICTTRNHNITSPHQ